MNKHQQSINQVEATAADERLGVALAAAYPAGEASSRLRGRVEELAARQIVLPVRAWGKPQATFALRCAGMMVVLGLVYMGLTMTSPGRSTPAFALVEQAMRKIKTAHWVQKRTVTEADGSLTYEAASDAWVRMNPLAKAVRSIPESFRSAPNETLHEFRSVIDRRGQVTYSAATKEYTIHRYTIPREFIRKGMKMEDLLRGMVLAEVLSPAEITPLSINKKSPPMRIGRMVIPNWSSERVTLDGEPRIKFHREYSYHENGGGTIKQAIWADPQTNRVVRSELRSTSLKPSTYEIIVVNEQYRYDEEPPEGTFDLTPPPGARVRIISPPQWTESPQKPSRAELQQVQSIIDRSEAAWRRGDFEAFAAVWDFAFDSKLTGSGTAPAGAARRRDWKRRIGYQRGRWSRFTSRIDMDSVRQYVSDGAKLTAPDKAKPDILKVEVISQGAWAEDGDAWKDIPTTYFLRRGKDGFHIVNWQAQTMWSIISRGH